MSTTCTRNLSLGILLPLPRCNCPGEVDNGAHCMIENYVDGMLNPGCGIPFDPGIGGPVWDGKFDVTVAGFCSWGATGAGVKTINGKLMGSCGVINSGAGFWALEVKGVRWPTDPYFWYGESPMGTGGVCSSPDGLIFTAAAPFIPPFCGTTPPTLKVIVY